MGKIYTIRLTRNDLGQLLDGLQCRSEAWANTAEYFETGMVSKESFTIEDCNDAEEARAIAELYDNIIADIKNQVKAQEQTP